MSMELRLLGDCPEALPVVAGWYWDEWGQMEADRTPQTIRDHVEECMNTDRIPLIVLALCDGEVVGAAQLKYREMSIYPELEHWLGGVYVPQEWRGRNIAERMIDEVVRRAREFEVPALYLQTFRLNGGLYSRLGWKAYEQVNYRNVDVLVMERVLTS